MIASQTIQVIDTANNYESALSIMAELMNANNITQVDIQIGFEEDQTQWAHIYCHYDEEDSERNSNGNHVDSVPYPQFEILPLSELDYFYGVHDKSAEEPMSLWIERA